MLEPVAPSCLNISPWRAKGTLFMRNSIILEPPKSGRVYSFGLQQASRGKVEGRTMPSLPNCTKGSSSLVLLIACTYSPRPHKYLGALPRAPFVEIINVV